MITWFRKLLDTWDRFLNDAGDPRIVPILRIGIAVCLLIQIAVVWNDAGYWFTDNGVVTSQTAQKKLSFYGWSVFYLLPSTEPVIQICLTCMAIHAALMLMGISSRLQAASLFFWLVSLQNRNPFILDGEDALLRLMLFFMIWLPLDYKFSLQKYWQKKSNSEAQSPSLWAMRLFQFEITAIYASTAIWKLQGSAWHDGSAMWYVSKMTDNYGRLLPSSFFDNYWASAIATWSALTIELILPFALWFPRTRHWAVALALLLHLGIESSMNLFLFQWLMILSLLTFIQLGKKAANPVETA